MKWVNKFSKKNFIYWKNIDTGIITKNNYQKINFDSVIEILKNYNVDSFRIFLSLFKIFFFKIPNSLKKMRATKWSYDNFGQKFSDDVWIPLLKGKFGKNWKKISAIWLATRVKRHLSTRDILRKKSKFGYLINTYNETIMRNISFIKKKIRNIISI